MSKEKALETLLKKRVYGLIKRAKQVEDPALTEFLSREAKDLCEYHDGGNLFLVLEYGAFNGKKK